MQASMQHHYAAYGFWAPAIHDYEEQGIMSWFGTPQNRALAKIEDPYEYRQRYTMPKLVLNDTGDQFFVPDSSQFYFDDLPEPKYLRYVPNTDHSMKGSDAWETMQAFYQSILTSAPLPRYKWTLEKRWLHPRQAHRSTQASEAMAGHQPRRPRFSPRNARTEMDQHSA
jgi:PhoPQ-activated pathogenicity-related protein